MGQSRAATLLAGAELARRAGLAPGTHDGAPAIRPVQDIVNQAVEIRDKKKEYLLAFFLMPAIS